MSLKKLLLVISVAWAVCVLVMLAVRTLLGVTPITPSEYLAWMFLACGPAVVALLVIRAGTATGSIGQVLYDAEHAEHADSTRVEAVRERLRTMKGDVPPSQP